MCALIRPQFLWKALTFLWYTSSPTCLLPTPCTIQLSDSRSLPTRDAFADCDFQLLDLPLAFYLGFWWWVSWRPWAMCFWATELVEPRVNQTWDFDTVWILRWVGPRPFASRGAVIFLWIFLPGMSWANGTQPLWMLCLRSTWFFRAWRIVIFQVCSCLPRIATLLCTLRCGVSHLNWCLCLG